MEIVLKINFYVGIDNWEGLESVYYAAYNSITYDRFLYISVSTKRNQRYYWLINTVLNKLMTHDKRNDLRNQNAWILV